MLIGFTILAALLRLWELDVLPPGLFFDEAFNGLDALDVISGEHRPLFFAANNGREPLFIYLLALAIRLLGPEAMTLRLVSAAVGILSVPIAYWSALTILRPTPQETVDENAYDALERGRWLALMAALGLVISFWHVSLSRLAFRAILLVPLSAMSVAFFWRAWTQSREKDFLQAGFWIGLSLYTYTAARLLPLVLLGFLAIELVIDVAQARFRLREVWQRWRPRLRGLIIMALVAAIVVLPLAVTLLRQPELLSARTADVSITTAPQEFMAGTPAERLLNNVVAVARSFYDQADSNPRHNLPGRSVNDPLLATLFTFGVITAIIRWKHPRYRLLLTWFGLMLLPTLLSVEAPHALRAAGALPPLVLLYAVGAGTIADWTARLAEHRRAPWSHNLRVAMPKIILVAVMVAGTAWTARDYFWKWAAYPGLGEAFDLEQQLAATAVRQHLADHPDAPMLVSYDLYWTPQMEFALGNAPSIRTADDQAYLASIDAGSVTVLVENAPDPIGSYFLLQRAGETVHESWLNPLDATTMSQLRHAAENAAEEGTRLQSPIQQPTWPSVALAMLPDGAILQPHEIPYPLDVHFANSMRLIGYRVTPAADPHPKESIGRLTLYWQGEERNNASGSTADPLVTSEFDVFVHLANPQGVWANDNGQMGNGYTIRRLLGREAVEDGRNLLIPAAMPDGKAHFEVGLYYYDPVQPGGGNDRIAIVNSSGEPVADMIRLGGIWVGSDPSPPDLTDLNPLGVQYEVPIELVGGLLQTDPSDPSRATVALGWRAIDRPPADFTAFVHLLDGQDQIISQYDQPPGGTDNPTSLWFPGEIVRSDFPLQYPHQPDGEDLRLRIGLYDPVSGEQIPLTSTARAGIGQPADRFILLPVADLNRHGS